MNYKLLLTPAGASTLRDFADIMPTVKNDIETDTKKLFDSYYSVADTLGPHNEQFKEMLIHVGAAQELFSDSIEVLHKKLHETADKIDDMNGTTDPYKVKKLGHW